MKTTLLRLSMLTVLLVLAGSAAASPLRVRTAGTKSQLVVMCPDCSQMITCAQMGDYLVGLSADLENPKFGLARFNLRVTDKDGAPVSNAKVALVLSMPEHGHASKPFTAKRAGKGKYVASTNALVMQGAWRAEVALTTLKGDTVKQVFTFTR
jgi:hypothetical protein